MTATTDTVRRFLLTKGGLSIILVQYVTGENTATYSWSVLSGSNLVGHGKFNGTVSVPNALKQIVNTVNMRTDVAHARLRTLTWAALDGHEHVPAVELRAGDVVNVNGMVTTVRAARVLDSGMVVTELDGFPQERRFTPTTLFNVVSRA